MCSQADSRRLTGAPELPPLPDDRWWGDHVRETRWQLELYRLLVDPIFRGRGVLRGDGRPVILMPGFGGGDETLLVLAAWLRRVALIGHSRGGHYARALGHRHPELVSHAISIGAGLRKMLAISYPTQLLAAGARRVVLRSGRARSPRCLTHACDCSFARDFAGPFPEDRVRLWSIYSKGDGVVRWQSALVPYGTCVEVTGSHVGLVFNRKTYRVIANALAEPELQSHPSGGARC
jgi:pimeloyl-ACP methyl ester carboxylesterase